ncbi:THAPSDRAFT_262120, partial [Thalassiosira pseudonana CCMP1335]
EADALIASILDEVGLSAQKDTVVGGMFKRGLSGGQKRRLSVALEAITSPLNMFLDEPTSGLDSESALRLMQYLHRYARGERRRVIVTIHQPSSRIWELIDNVVLMAEGRLIYQGRRQQMEDFFTAYGHPVPPNFNPADHYIEALAELPIPSPSTDEDCNATESQSTAEMWYESFRETESVVIRSDPSNRTLKARKQVQSTLLSSFELIRRSFTGLYKNPVVLGLRVAVYTGISVALGILFFNLANDRNPHSILIGRTSILYFVVAFFSTMSVAAIPFAIVERGIVQKEVRNHRYHPVFYHLSQAISSLPACL